MHEGLVCTKTGRFREMIHIGIGGSALGPQMLCDALRTNHDPIRINFLDNADPESINSLIERLDDHLDTAIVSVVSKCGFTPTPRYVEQQVEKAYESRGLKYSDHAVATTTPASELEHLAQRNSWLARFTMWDWVGGRFSVTSTVGLLPAALQGVDIRAFLEGAAAIRPRNSYQRGKQESCRFARSNVVLAWKRAWREKYGGAALQGQA